MEEYITCIEVVGIMDGSYEKTNRVYGQSGISPTVEARDYKDPKRVIEIDVIGARMDGAYEMPNRVYGVGGLAPSIRTFHGGSLEPKVVSVEKLGNASNGNTQSRSVYDSNGLRPTLCAGMGPKGNTMPMVVDVVAMRGRDPNNPSDRSAGNPNLEQTLEVNSEGICNCLTTVQKDNMVVESACLRMVRTEEGKALRKQYESHEISSGFNEHREAEPRTDGCTNTITTVQKDNMVIEAQLGDYLVSQNTAQGYALCKPGGVADLSYPTSKTRRGRVIENGEISPTLTTASIPSVLEDWIWEVDGVLYLVRIRKLTPKECWRLMGCSDEDFEKAASVNSNTQLYKQAGNSIVVDVLEQLFSALIYPNGQSENVDEQQVDSPTCVGGVGNLWGGGGKQFHQQHRVYTSDGVAMCHPANLPGGSYNYVFVEEVKNGEEED